MSKCLANITHGPNTLGTDKCLKGRLMFLLRKPTPSAIPETFGLVQQLQPSNGTIPRKVAVMHTIPGWRFGIEFRIHRWVHLDVSSESTGVVSSPWLDLPDFCDHLEGNSWRTIINSKVFSFQPCNFGAGETFPSKNKPCSLPPSIPSSKVSMWRSCSFQLLVSGQGLSPPKRTNIR